MCCSRGQASSETWALCVSSPAIASRAKPWRAKGSRKSMWHQGPRERKHSHLPRIHVGYDPCGQDQ
eukprot:11780392-Alexandrium_andersonii.AAC.1